MKYFFEAGVGSIPAFSMAGTAVKASGTDAQPDAAGSVLWGLGSFPNKQKSLSWLYYSSLNGCRS